VPDRGRWLRDHPLDLAIVIFTAALPSGPAASCAPVPPARAAGLVKAGVLAGRVFSTEGVRDAAVLTLIAVLGGGAAFAHFENDQDLSAWAGVWWAITTVTTVGYGTPEVTRRRAHHRDLPDGHRRLLRRRAHRRRSGTLRAPAERGGTGIEDDSTTSLPASTRSNGGQVARLSRQSLNARLLVWPAPISPRAPVSDVSRPSPGPSAGDARTPATTTETMATMLPGGHRRRGCRRTGRPTRVPRGHSSGSLWWVPFQRSGRSAAASCACSISFSVGLRRNQ
jgi:Ion channel